MDVMKGDFDKKKWTFIGLGAVLIIAVVLFFVFKGDTQDKVETQAEDEAKNDPNMVYGSDGSKYRYEQAIEEEEAGTEDVQVVIPTTVYGGKVSSYTDRSTYGELKIGVGGSGKKQKTFKLNPSGIVFDASKNRVVVPSEIKNGKNVRVLASGSSQANAETIEAVIMNDAKDIVYTPVSGVDKSDESPALLDDSRGTKYIVSKSTKTINALTGEPFDKSRFKTGDRVFVYQGKKVSSPASFESGKEYQAFTAKQVYVYPSAEVQGN